MPNILSPGLANSAVTEEDFHVKTTRNFINLCTASPRDLLYGEAINFCYGYLVGAYHYSIAEASDDPKELFVCLNPSPRGMRRSLCLLPGRKSVPSS